MGFLSGAFGKLMAGKYLRTLQYKSTIIQSRLRRVTREVGQMDKMFSAKEKQIKAAIQSQGQAQIMAAMGKTGMDYTTVLQSLDESGMRAYSTTQMAVQMQMTQSEALWLQMLEMEKESLLQPLKDLEEDLQSEKDNLESQIKIAQAEYDAKKEEEKAGAKSLAPDYTGQS